MNLYWCETSDHDEDWFSVTPSVREACRSHEGEEGYALGDAHATLVCRMPKQLTARAGWPDHALLKALGAVFLSDQTPRIVQFGKRIYREGGMDGVLNRLADDLHE